MKTRNTIVFSILILLAFLSSNIYADVDFEKAMLKAKKNLKEAMDKNDQTKLLKARGEFERILQLKKEVWLVNYYIALSDWGLASNAMVAEKTEDVKKYTQSGIEIVNKSLDINPEFAESYILLEALNFNRWQYEQEKMQDIITATQSADTEAKRLEPNNPRYQLITGIAQFYTPEMYGGGEKVALPTLEKSADLFKTRTETNKLYPDWGYDMALGYIALCLIKRDDDGDMAKAKDYIDLASKMNPDSLFISKYVADEYKKSAGSK